MTRRLFKWRCTDPVTGKKFVTRHYASEAEIRLSHPEAERIDHEYIDVESGIDAHGFSRFMGEGTRGK